MVTAVLRALVLPLVFATGCSLVVDTDECATDADCRFDDGSSLQCVKGECVPRRTELVSSALERDTRWTADRRWIVDGVVVIDERVSLTVDSGTHVEVRADAALVFESSDSLSAPAATQKPAIIHSYVGAGAVFMSDGQPIPETLVFR